MSAPSRQRCPSACLSLSSSTLPQGYVRPVRSGQSDHKGAVCSQAARICYDSVMHISKRVHDQVCSIFSLRISYSRSKSCSHVFILEGVLCNCARCEHQSTQPKAPHESKAKFGQACNDWLLFSIMMSFSFCVRPASILKVYASCWMSGSFEVSQCQN